MRYAIGGCELDVEARQLSCGGEAVHLSPKAFALLEFLVAQRPRAVPRQELYDHLWPDTFVVEANLAILIREIRTALGGAGDAIRTVHRLGYACAPEREVTPRAPAAAHVLMRGEREYILQPGENLVGRDPAAAVRISSSSVSRRHASIIVTGERATLVDLTSKNGTRLDGVPVAVPCDLEEGSVIEFGKIEMVYRRSAGLLPTETSR